MFSWCKRASSRSAAFVGFVSFIIGATALVEPTRAEEVVGATAGELGVTADGSASYGIQIAVPPGTTGVQPKLSLQYDSQTGNGVLGVGFSLGGLPRLPHRLWNGAVGALAHFQHHGMRD